MEEKMNLLEMSGITKSFPGVKALKGVQLDLRPGEVHALLGENGAGKSTLIKVLGGIYSKDEGTIKINGKEVEIKTVEDARENGISIIHQEIVLVPGMTIADNIYLGKELGGSWNIDRKKAAEETQALLDAYHMDLRADTLVGELTIAQQQMVEIIRATAYNAQIIVMDEPTSSISEKEVDALFDIIRNLKKKGCGIIYISHRMSELDEVADRVSVYRDGEYVATKVVSETTTDELVALMVGRQMDNYYTHEAHFTDETVLEVKNLKNAQVHDVSFSLKKGEILGFAGLVGAGRTETMRAIFGMDELFGGEVFIHGEKVHIKSSTDAINAGIALVPEDRKGEGIFSVMSLKFNLTIKVLNQFMKNLRVDYQKENEITDEYMEALSVRAAGPQQSIGSLSGGNQQKVVVASWLATKPKILIMDEPTRGIDVGAKAEIYSIMNDLTSQGVSIIMVSSELPEVINMSDRVVVMRSGEISAVLEGDDINQVTIMKNAVNV